MVKVGAEPALRLVATTSRSFVWSRENAKNERSIPTFTRDTMTAAHFDIPERSIGVRMFAALISALRWAILLALLVLFAPYALDYFDNARTHPAAKYVYEGRDYLLRTAGPQIRAH